MVVFTVDVNHFDPLGRMDLLAQLRALASRHSNPPAFVAVEYAQHHFRLIADLKKFALISRRDIEMHSLK